MSNQGKFQINCVKQFQQAIQQNQKNFMLRVQLKVSKVGIRIKQHVQIQVLIKKNEQTFPLSKTATLKNCVAELNANSQFFVELANPTFSVCTMILLQTGRKLAGVYSVDLRNYQKNCNNLIQGRLQKSPDSQAWILFQFSFNSSHYLDKDRNLVQLNKLQYQNMNQVASQMQQQNSSMVDENTKLNEKLQRLKRDNFNLLNNRNNINHYEDNLNQNVSQDDGSLSSTSQYNQNDMKQKIQKMRLFAQNHNLQETKNEVFQTFKQQSTNQ